MPTFIIILLSFWAGNVFSLFLYFKVLRFKPKIEGEWTCVRSDPVSVENYETILINNIGGTFDEIQDRKKRIAKCFRSMGIPVRK